MTVLTRAQLNDDADTFLPDNTTAEISPQDIRDRIKNLADSALLPEEVPFTPADAADPASLDFHEDTDNGSHKVTLQAPAALAADATVTLPSSTGTLATTADVASQIAATDKVIASFTALNNQPPPPVEFRHPRHPQRPARSRL